MRLAQSTIAALAGDRRVRADAQRNVSSLIAAAKQVFARAGNDAPVREIAACAGVGVGTVYRHFPTRADLVAAVFSHEIDACANAADHLRERHPPLVALSLWLEEFVELISTKRGLGEILHSGDPAFDAMPAKRDQRLFPAFRTLFDACVDAGVVRTGIEASDFLTAATGICMAVGKGRSGTAVDLVLLLKDGITCVDHRAG